MALTEKNFISDAIGNLPAIVNNPIVTETFSEFLGLQHLYDSAIKTVETHLGILDGEFSVKFQRNPIHSVDSRLKSANSIIEKLQKKGLAVTPDSAMRNLLDIAGVRVTCYYIEDIYTIAHLITCHHEFVTMKIKDYILNPKASGYRSYHIVVNVPVYLSDKRRYAPVEIQIRTIAMDFWASLEHQLKYKYGGHITEEIAMQLKECADTISETDKKMQSIYFRLGSA